MGDERERDARWPRFLSRVGMMSRPGALLVGLLGFGIWMVAPWGMFAELASTHQSVAVGVLMAVWGAGVLALPTLLRLRRHATLGADGIAFRSFGRESFLAFTEIESVHVDATRISLRLHDGTYRYLQGLDGPKGRLLDPRNDPFLLRLRELWSEARAAREAPSLESVLARGARPMSEWVGALEALAARPDDYREGALDREGVLALAEDARAEPTARAAAAFVLRRTGADARERARLKEASSATAHPRVRVVLDAAGGDGEDLPVETMEGLSRAARRP